MLDFGFDKIALISAVALIVIGPEKLPRVARTVGALIGKAQRYVADVKAEVNRSIELEELQKMKKQFETAATESKARCSARSAMRARRRVELSGATAGLERATPMTPLAPLPPTYKRPNKKWRSSGAPRRCGSSSARHPPPAVWSGTGGPLRPPRPR
jgi:sec-independent protein translocase protein TatB